MPTPTDVLNRLQRFADGKTAKADRAGEAEWLSAAIDDLTDEQRMDADTVRSCWVKLARAIDPRALRPIPAGADVRDAARQVVASARFGEVGRPAVGVTVEVRLPAAVVEQVEQWRTTWGLSSTAEAHRRVLAAGLEALGTP